MKKIFLILLSVLLILCLLGCQSKEQEAQNQYNSATFKTVVNIAPYENFNEDYDININLDTPISESLAQEIAKSIIRGFKRNSIIEGDYVLMTSIYDDKDSNWKFFYEDSKNSEEPMIYLSISANTCKSTAKWIY